MTEPYVSIIIPVYNEERLLNRCLESIINQTFTDIEIIIIDDASLDNSKKIIEKIAPSDKRIIFIEHKTNKGQGEARNTGIRESCGRYVFFIDADDYMPHDGLESLCKIAREHDDDIIYGKTESRVNVDGMYITHEMRSITLQEYPPLLYNHSVWNKLIKRTFILNNCLLFAPPRYAEDIAYALKSNLYADRISITTKVTYNYHWSRQFENVTKQKITDARNNVLSALRLIDEYGCMSLSFEMKKKTACNVYGSMIRATAVYNRRELHEHLKWWQPILAAMPVTVFNEIPPYQGEFCRLIVKNRMEEALALWRNTRLINKMSNFKLTRLFFSLKNYILHFGRRNTAA